MSPSLDDLDPAALSAEARDALELIAWPMADHDLTLAEAAKEAGRPLKWAGQAMKKLAAEWCEQASRGR